MSAAPGRPQGSHGITRQEADLDAFSDRCLAKGEPISTFYPPTGAAATRAKQFCAACPVKDACLAYALKYDERFGVWGGTSEKDRFRIKRGLRSV